MFQPGQIVKVIARSKDDSDELRFLIFLSEGKIFHVLEFDPPEECTRKFPGKIYWQENGGRMVLQELPGLEYFGRRFEAVQ